MLARGRRAVETGQIDDAVFARWLAWDPVEMIELPEHRDNLRKMRLVYVDCGSKDEYHLHWGARGFVRRLRALGIAHEYAEFPEGHRNTSHRLDLSLPKLYAALTG